MSHINVKCGTCQFFREGPPHPKFGSLCEKLGVREYAEAPNCYSPVAIKIVRADVDVSEIGKHLRHLNSDQMQVIGQLITQAAALEQLRLKFGQPVYVNLGSNDYLTNYYKGYVLGVIQVDGADLVYVSSDLTFEQTNDPEFRSLLRLNPESLMTGPQFKAHREKLVASGRLESPPSNKTGPGMPLTQWLRLEDRPMPKDGATATYDPPSIDTAPQAWLDPFSVTELESLKADKTRRRSDKGIVTLDSEAQEKRRERSRKRLNMKVVVDEDGNVYSTVAAKVSIPSLPVILRR